MFDNELNAMKINSNYDNGFGEEAYNTEEAYDPEDAFKHGQLDADGFNGASLPDAEASETESRGKKILTLQKIGC